ncbi:protein kinase domain-containing protein [Calothrix sp. PCC 6303]|uniref:protein kinase domain-containing protein n=1 Tax=Calothrix sp. PCC 6303 TaxID=1170562 RepID=UPI0002A0347F|nr:YARHG domain-containing protein [Calothrix sp. PCC 6303]AFY99692.1 serine/threonine protein kinase [Calothrix sp. PCC 6303]
MQTWLNNRYRVIQTLGSGGFGETFLAEDTQMPSQRRCVIKLLKPVTTSPQIYQLVQERFQREAAILEELGGGSNQIPNLYAYFQQDSQFYLVQEWVEGLTLTEKVRREGRVPEQIVQELLISLLGVIEYVHGKRIVHRDIKPDNIIIRYRDQKPVLIDFGAVRESMGTVVNSQGSPTSSIIIGTPGYMPSEQAAGRPVYSSDLYSLGITSIYLLTGKQPQQLDSDPQTGEIVWRQFATGVSNEMMQIIDHAIAYHPRERFSSAREMLDALGGVVNTVTPAYQVPATLPSSPETIPVIPQTTHSPRPNNSIFLGSLIAGGLIGASTIIALVLTRFSQSPINNTIGVTTPTEIPTLSGFIPENTLTPQPSKNSISNNTTPIVISSPQGNQTGESSFYFLADTAFSANREAEANKQIRLLQTQGYGNAGMLWIPDYPNLSGKQLFEVYAGKFSDRASCIELLRSFGKQNPDSYCIFASKNAKASPDRFYYKQITNSSASPVVSSSATENDYAFLSQRLVRDEDLANKTPLELDIMRNSIFAKYGRKFDTPGLQDYFNRQSWYQPKYSSQDFDKLNLLSRTEMQNASYIIQYQKKNNLLYFR